MSGEKVEKKRITAEDIGLLFANAIAPGEDYKPSSAEFHGWLAEQINEYFGELYR
jgi:hypothetical protein